MVVRPRRLPAILRIPSLEVLDMVKMMLSRMEFYEGEEK